MRRFSVQRRWITASLLFWILVAPGASWAQYFGQNKVRYESLRFRVLQTPHFDIHYYDEEQDAAQQLGRMAERWYARLSRVLGHELTPHQPIILYASATAFRGTTAIPGYIGETTGGVTEGMRRRLVMPFAGPMSETDHVLGHELVHAFQFDIASRTGGGQGAGLSGALELPLWFVEGMAEYLSLGPVDPQTAMWLRDAVLRQDMPPVKKLDDPRYFPYRYGQAFWAFIGGRFGDETIGQILRRAGRTGSAEAAISSTVNMSIDALSHEWHAELTTTYAPVLELTQSPESAARRIVGSVQQEPGSSLNVAPVLSPDGRRMIFFSAKDLFSVDLFLADAENGAIIDKITKTATDPHFDSLGFVSSAGAWSSDGSRFAFAGVSEGRPELDIYNVAAKRIERRTKIRTLGEILNLTWSPNGSQIAFSATSHGVTDLFIFDLETGNTRQLTNDFYADLQPAWSPDGRWIAFVTDRFTSNVSELAFGNYGLALIDPGTGNITRVMALDRGKHTNPQWSSDSASLYFISDPDGVANIYRVSIRGMTPPLRQLTNLQTGVSGITSLSPAFSLATRAKALVFTAFGNANYVIYRIDGAGVEGMPVANALAKQNAGSLPPIVRTGAVVPSLLADTRSGLPGSGQFPSTAYHARLSLDGVAPPQVGIGIGSFGSFIGGGTAFQWSDLLGYHSLTTLVQTTATTEGGNFLNGLTAVGIYQNQQSRWDWGFIGGQVPLITGGFSQSTGTVNGEPVLIGQSIQLWQIDRELLGTLSYPLNRARRIELSAGYQNVSFKEQARTSVVSLRSGDLLLDELQDLPTPGALRMGRTGAAFVSDTSIIGGISPLNGARYRFEYGLSAGTLTYSTALVDYRRYFQLARRLTFAGRLLHFGRYGAGAEDPRQQDLFLGYPALVRGYTAESFTIDECGPQININGACPAFDRLLGSRLAVANAEIRVPILGFLGVVPSRSLPPVEGGIFYDAGAAWRSTEKLNFLGGSRKPVTSYGASLRFNIFGFAIGQLSLVHPNSRPAKDWRWEFSFTPGF
jgi:Tol biopolymer transport system component